MARWYGAAPYVQRLLLHCRNGVTPMRHCTCPATGSRRIEVVLLAISAAMHTCAGLAPNSSQTSCPLSTPRRLPGGRLGTEIEAFIL